MNPMSRFHPAVSGWFSSSFAAPTLAQAQAWPAIQDGRNVLIAAPTGSGKTLAAFLAAIDDLVRKGLAGELSDQTHVVYVSPLKALSNDIKKNLEAPLAGIREGLKAQGLPDVEIRTWVRTGDTPAAERNKARKKPPHIVVTTPESLYILLGSESGRAMLATTRSIIIDEIHALAPNKRGSHLSLSLERLAALCPQPLLRIGLSATQKPIEEVANFLIGAGSGGKPRAACEIIDTGHVRARDLAIEVPPSPLESVMSHEVWEQVYDRLTDLIGQHRTTLVFVNTRRLAERVTGHLAERLGEENVAAHHGSLAKEHRLNAEQRLKHGQLKALVATASLELGIDIGDVDLVCQIGSPRSIASFLQRVGRSGHSVSGTPKGRLFPLSRDELVECTALLDSVKRGELDRLTIPAAPADVLAQQIVAEVAAREWSEDDLYAMVRQAWPYRNLPRDAFTSVVRMLADGFSTRRGRRGALIHRDAVGGMLRGRKGARLTALTSGGAIPDNADYKVLLEPENNFIGTVNEDFAVESLAGDIFQLGNHSYRILRVERGAVRVEDAHGQPPSIPFWLGEAPGRSDELSSSVSRLRTRLAELLTIDPSRDIAQTFLMHEVGLGEAAALELTEYLAAAHGALGCLPTQQRIVLERFFDEAGGMQLVVHSPFGSRINRAWGLALRKRFCRKFNFELQAAATEDNIILSLTTAHSFELAEVSRYLHSNSIRELLIQALIDAPMFVTRWRWVSGISLAQPRFRGGKKIAPQLARMGAEDLLVAVFPDQVACAENLVGEREIPDHPLVNQTIADCLGEAMDLEGLQRVLRRIEAGEIEIVACDLNQPSPLALEVLSARPYAYLDDAPLEERRTQAVMARRWLAPEAASDLGRLDPEAIARVRAEAWPDAANPDELHDALVWLGFLTRDEVARHSDWDTWLHRLAEQKRVTQLGPGALWIGAERLPQFHAVFSGAACAPPIAAPAEYARAWSREEALVEIVRGRLEGQGPLTLAGLVEALGAQKSDVAAALTALEAEGFALRGRFTADAGADEWCERRLLARIHSYTIKRLRAEIEPVSSRDFMRFLLGWQRVAPDARMEGAGALDTVVAQLEGFEAAAGAWERDILPSRLVGYDPVWLDERCLGGHLTWARLKPRAGNGESRAAPVSSTPITLLPRRHASVWASLATRADEGNLSASAQAVAECLRQNGASFFAEIVDGTGLLRTQVEAALAELVALGIVSSDSFAGLRALLTPASERETRRRRVVKWDMEHAGRWALARRPAAAGAQLSPEAIEHVARALLQRYGVVFWRLLAREADWLPPWRDLLRVYRRLESRGEIRGGRFVAGFSGEQFALPDAIGRLRAVRREAPSESYVSVSGADPLNLAGILTPGPKLAALTGNRVLYRDGVPVALLAGGEVTYLEPLAPADEWKAKKALVRGAVSGSRDPDATWALRHARTAGLNAGERPSNAVPFRKPLGAPVQPDTTRTGEAPPVPRLP
jgi:ATP-dependent Lhr-like helicase